MTCRALAGCVFAVAASVAYAQSYPSKPIRLLIGYVPGGAADFTARLLAQRLQATR